eukprot:GHVL01044822.1.p1 GENE.GHVL01044822.1~~GHVL01044822.1.p1  ORF type:complete len:443 (-),score=70.42 GHVL01044822.1:88-1416(-)
MNFVGVDGHHGDKVIISCNNGRSATRGISPEEIKCSNGDWTTRTLSCADDCPPFSNDSLGSAYIISGEETGVEHFVGTRKIKCSAGYKPLSGPPGDEETLMCAYGHWQDRTILCAGECPQFPELSHGLEVDGEGTGPGSYRDVNCKDGWVADEGYSPERVFCSYGNWTEQIVSCRPDVFARWTNKYDLVWESDAVNATSTSSFWRPKKEGNYLPLGDYAVRGTRIPKYPSLILQGNVRAPESMIPEWSDRGSKGIVWDYMSAQMIAPDGYVCLGNAGMNSTKVIPTASDYVCVPKDCTEEVPMTDTVAIDTYGGLIWSNDHVGEGSAPFSAWESGNYFLYEGGRGMDMPYTEEKKRIRLKFECIRECPPTGDDGNGNIMELHPSLNGVCGGEIDEIASNSTTTLPATPPKDVVPKDESRHETVQEQHKKEGTEEELEHAIEE